MLIVQKYGGTSLGDTRRLQAAARRIAGLAHQGARMVVVVSAQGVDSRKNTNKLQIRC